MINVSCQTCGKNFKLRDELAGREGKCPCGAVLVIPSKRRAAVITAASPDGRPSSEPASASSSTYERQPIRETNWSHGLSNSVAKERVASPTESAEHNKQSPQTTDPAAPAKPRSKTRVTIIVGAAVALIVAAVTADIIFVAIPNNRKVTETFNSVVKQTDQIAAMRDKAAKQQEDENAAKLAAALAQQPGSIEGEVWVEKASGDSLAIESENVFLFPLEIKTDGPSGKFDFGLTMLQMKVRAGEELPANKISVAMAHDAAKALDPMKPYIASGSVPSLLAINASICALDLKAVEFDGLPFRPDNSRMEKDIVDEPFWKVVSTQSVREVETGRDGKFVMDDCPPGKYVLACRTFKPALNAVVYWNQPVEVKPGKSLKMDLKPTNAVLISY